MFNLNSPAFASTEAALEQSRGLPPGILKAVALTESGGNPNAVSKAGAQGLMQFEPATAQAYNVDTSNPWDSLRGAADYLGDLLHQYGSVPAALAAYNGGSSQGQLVAQGKQPTYPETSQYIHKVVSLMPQSNSSVDPQVSGYIVQQAAHGASPTAILGGLSQTPLAENIQHLRAAGVTDQDIVERLAGPAYQHTMSEIGRANNQGVVGTAIDEAKSVGGDWLNAGQQLWDRATGNNAGLRELQQQQLAKDNDPFQQALGHTLVGSATRYGMDALPYVGAGVLTDGASLPVMALGQAGAGAAQGALTPTTGPGQIVPNVLTGAAIGGGATLGAGALGALGDAALSKAIRVSPEEQAARAELAARAKDMGLPVTPAGVSPFYKNLIEGSTSAPVQAYRDKVSQALANSVGRSIGETEPVGAINSDLVNRAEGRLNETYGRLNQFTVNNPEELHTNLSSALNQNTDPGTTGLSPHTTARQIVSNIGEMNDAGMPITGQTLQKQATALKEVLRSPGASFEEKQAARDMLDVISQTQEQNMTPEQVAEFKAANEQYKHLVAVKNMVLRSGDSGVVTPQQIMQAAKSGSFKNQFVRGNAPFQDLADVATQLYGKGNGQGLGAMLNKAVNGGGDTLEEVAGLVHPSPLVIGGIGGRHLLRALGERLAVSENPATLARFGGVGATEVSPIASALAQKLDGGEPPVEPPSGPTGPTPPQAPQAPTPSTAPTEPVAPEITPMPSNAPTGASGTQSPVAQLLAEKLAAQQPDGSSLHGAQVEPESVQPAPEQPVQPVQPVQPEPPQPEAPVEVQPVEQPVKPKRTRKAKVLATKLEAVAPGETPVEPSPVAKALAEKLEQPEAEQPTPTKKARKPRVKKPAYYEVNPILKKQSGPLTLDALSRSYNSALRDGKLVKDEDLQDLAERMKGIRNEQGKVRKVTATSHLGKELLARKLGELVDGTGVAPIGYKEIEMSPVAKVNTGGRSA